jgi:hypothetical protein
MHWADNLASFICQLSENPGSYLGLYSDLYPFFSIFYKPNELFCSCRNLPIYNAQTTWPPHLQSSGFESSPAFPGLGSLSSQGVPGAVPRSPHPSRTSPVAVPVSSHFRHRNDSNSSLSVGR